MGRHPTPLDPRYYDPDYRSVHSGKAQARYLYHRERARARPPPEPVPVIRQCRICQRRIGAKRWYCEACRANLNNGFNRRLVSERRAAGQCVRCGERAVEGQTCCGRCKAMRRKRYKPGVAAVHHARQLADRQARAVCTICEATVATGRKRCEACLSDGRLRHRRDRARWRAAGRCSMCGGTPKRGKKVCPVCVARGNTLRAKNQAAGWCRCGRFKAKDRQSCPACLSLGRDGQRRRRGHNPRVDREHVRNRRPQIRSKKRVLSC